MNLSGNQPLKFLGGGRFSSPSRASLPGASPDFAKKVEALQRKNEDQAYKTENIRATHPALTIFDLKKTTAIVRKTPVINNPGYAPPPGKAPKKHGTPKMSPVTTPPSSYEIHPFTSTK